MEEGMMEGSQFVNKTLTGLAFTGGCLAAVIFYLPMLWPRGFLAGTGLLLLLVLALLVGLGKVGSLTLRHGNIIRWGLVLQLALLIVAGIHIFALAFTDLNSHRDAPAFFMMPICLTGNSSLTPILVGYGDFCFLYFPQLDRQRPDNATHGPSLGDFGDAAL